MTTIQLAQRAMRHLTAADLSALPVDEAAHVMDAINSVLSDYLFSLPAEQRITPVSRVLRAPLQQRIAIVRGAMEFAYVAGSPYPAGGYALEMGLVGNTVAVEGDASVNRLDAPGTLLKAFMGESGDVTATFYGDATPMDTLMTSVAGEVIYQSDISGPIRLRPLDMPIHDMHLRGAAIETGTPLYWWTENFHRMERIDSPAWHLRVWPLPVTAGTISLKLETAFQPVRMVDFQSARSIPIEAAHEGRIVALLHEELLVCPLLRAGTPVEEIKAAALRARHALDRESSRRRSGRPNRIGTRRGY